MTTYCILNKNSDKYINEVSSCGIKIMMNQSFISSYPDIILLFIGKIYDIETWISNLHLPLETTVQDIIIHLYKKYGIEYTLNVLDGVFSLILFDYNYENTISKIYIVKDYFGIIPFYCFTNNKTIIFTSSKIVPDKYREHILNPGSYTIYELGFKVNEEWVVSPIEKKPYFLLPNTIISSSINNNHLSLLTHCMKKIILNFVYLTDDEANIVVEKLFLQMNYTNDKLYDIEIYDDVIKKRFTFSPLNFFMGSDSFESMFDFDNIIRNNINLTFFESGKNYPFYDKTFIHLYFSIPLHIRYNYRKNLFSIDILKSLL
jgi:hypothetical protein